MTGLTQYLFLVLRRSRVWFLGAIICACSFNLNAQTIEVKHSKAREGSVMDAYAIDLLAFLISLNGEKAKLIPFEGSESQPRKQFQLRNGDFDVDWFGGAPIDENRIEPVRYPIMRGLLGYRIFITNKAIAPKLKSMPLPQLQALHLVQGEGWGDVAFLRSGGFTHINTVTNFESLFKLVELQRGDVFPRSITEPFGELAERCQLNAQYVCEDRNLLVDPYLMVSYKLPLFFFVSPKRPDLRFLLENAFKHHYDEFLHFFNNHPLIKTSLQHMKGRTLYELDASNVLSPETQVIPAKYWLKP